MMFWRKSRLPGRNSRPDRPFWVKGIGCGSRARRSGITAGQKDALRSWYWPQWMPYSDAATERGPRALGVWRVPWAPIRRK